MTRDQPCFAAIPASSRSRWKDAYWGIHAQHSGFPWSTRFYDCSYRWRTVLQISARWLAGCRAEPSKTITTRENIKRIDVTTANKPFFSLLTTVTFGSSTDQWLERRPLARSCSAKLRTDDDAVCLYFLSGTCNFTIKSTTKTNE